MEYFAGLDISMDALLSRTSTASTAEAIAANCYRETKVDRRLPQKRPSIVTVGTQRTGARPTTDRPGRTATVRSGCSGEAHSPTRLWLCAPLRGFVTTRTFDTTQTGSGRRET